MNPALEKFLPKKKSSNLLINHRVLEYVTLAIPVVSAVCVDVGRGIHGVWYDPSKPLWNVQRIDFPCGSREIRTIGIQISHDDDVSFLVRSPDGWVDSFQSGDFIPGIIRPGVNADHSKPIQSSGLLVSSRTTFNLKHQTIPSFLEIMDRNMTLLHGSFSVYVLTSSAFAR